MDGKINRTLASNGPEQWSSNVTHKPAKPELPFLHCPATPPHHTSQRIIVSDCPISPFSSISHYVTFSSKLCWFSSLLVVIWDLQDHGLIGFKHRWDEAVATIHAVKGGRKKSNMHIRLAKGSTFWPNQSSNLKWNNSLFI